MKFQAKNSSLFTFGGVPWEQEISKQPQIKYGSTFYVGPIGAGKTLLAILRAREFYLGKVRDENGNCVCGDTKCNGKWKIITNLESPSMPDYGAWTTKLDLQNHLMDLESSDMHIIILIDEITQYFNSRRGMLNAVVRMLNAATLIRKKMVHLWGTGISFDWLDKRLKEMASIVYNCWTTNEGETVNAMVYNLRMGHLPPWSRKKPPTIKKWYTHSAKGFYDTGELINAETEFAEAQKEPVVFLEKDGVLQEIEIGEIVANIIADQLKTGETRTSVEKIVDVFEDMYNLPVSNVYVRDWLGSQFVRVGNEYIIKVQQKEGVLS